MQEKVIWKENNMLPRINIKKMYDNAILPTRAHEADAGYDLYASDSDFVENEKIVIPPLQSKMIKTGIAMAIPDTYVGLVFGRSGLGIKQGLAPRNCVGVIDSNYRGEIMVCLHNDNEKESKEVAIGDRIAQIVVVPYLKYDMHVVDELDETDRGEKGLGSSGH